MFIIFKVNHYVCDYFCIWWSLRATSTISPFLIQSVRSSVILFEFIFNMLQTPSFIETVAAFTPIFWSSIFASGIFHIALQWLVKGFIATFFLFVDKKTDVCDRIVNFHLHSRLWLKCKFRPRPSKVQSSAIDLLSSQVNCQHFLSCAITTICPAGIYP